MFSLAIHMLKSDMKTIFPGKVLIIFPLFLIVVLMMPFVVDSNMYYTFYVMLGAIALLRPRFTRIYHVLPLTIQQIKKLVLYRILILLFLLLGSGLVIVTIAELMEWEWNRRCGLWLIVYLEIYLGMMEERLRCFNSKERKNIGFTILMAIGIGFSLFNTYGLLSSVIPLSVEYLLQVLLFATCVPHVVFITGEMDFYDYQRMPEVLGGRPLVLE